MRQSELNEMLLFAAKFSDFKKVVKALDRGADIGVKDYSKRTALHWAVFESNAAIVKLLLDRGADIEAKDHAGQTCLIKSVLFNDIDIVKLLLKRGANIKAKDNDGNTALDLAKNSIAKLLKSHEAENDR